MTQVKPEDAKKEFCRKTVFRIWCENTTLHGVIDWYKGQSFSRCFWGLLVLGFTVGVSWQIHGLIEDYVTYPHYTSTVYLQEAEAAAFPNITICNMNRINKTKADEINFTGDAVSQMFLSQVGLYDVDTLTGGVDSKPLPALGKQMEAWNEFWPRSGYKDLADILRDMGHGCQATMFKCKFGGSYFDCCQHAKPVLSSEYGLCWSLTPPIQKNKHVPQQYFTGISMGLKIFLAPGLEYYNNDAFYNNYLEQGLIVVATYNPYEFWYNSRLIVPPGSHASVKLQKTSYNFKRPMFRVFKPECAIDATTKYVSGKYTLQNCIAECAQEVANSECKCYIVGEVKNKHHAACTPNQMMSCFHPKLFAAITAMASNPHSNDMARCMVECKSPCDERHEVSMSASVNKFPSQKHVIQFQDFYEEISKDLVGFKNRPTTEYVESWIALDFYFSERGHTVVESQAKIAIFTLVGNIGGQLGLWLGASLLTVLQLIYYMIMFVAPWCASKKIERS